VTGRRIHYIHSLHEHYGPIVRISPSEIAVADLELVQQIHCQGSGFTKSDWYLKFTTNPRQSLFTLSNHKEYTARRRMLARGFSKSELRVNWEAEVRQRVDLAVRIMVEEGKDGPVDVLKWLILMAMDISTRVVFGYDHKILEARQVSGFHYARFKPLTLDQATEHMRLLQCRLQGCGVASEIPLIRIFGPRIPLQICQELFNSDPILHSHARVAVAHSRLESKQKNIFANIIKQAEKDEVLDD
jgi:hypothetical protein